MMTSQVIPTAKQRKQILNIIWFAFTAFVGTYWFVYIITKAGTPNASASWLIIAMAIISLIECIGAWIFYRITISKISRQVAQAEAAGLPSEAVAALEGRLQVTAIICLAVFEAIVIYGLVCSFWGSPYPNTFERFTMFGLLNLIIYRLRAYPEIFNLLDRLEKIRREIK